MNWLKQQFASATRLWSRDIWTAESLTGRAHGGRLHAALRIISITLSGLHDNKAASRAAALSFSSLLGLGPLVAIAMMVAGFMLNEQDPNLAVNTLNRLITFIAPQIEQYEDIVGDAPPIPRDQRSDVLSAARPGTADAEPAVTDSDVVPVRPELVELINGFVESSRSGAVGALGALTLILIVLQLFTSIETAFNEIWGVHRGRSWLTRIVYYWTVLTLGAVLFFAALTGLGAGTFLNAFAESIPFGAQLLGMLRLLLPAGSMMMLILILTLFYRTVPNTHVYWFPAVVGALVVALLIISNNVLAFLYLKRVVLSKSLYGSLGILPILMFGMFVFWFFVLLGGQVSYAVQNVRFRNSQVAWNQLAENMRERLSLVVLLTVCRRFQACAPPPTSSQLGELVGVPTQLLNECLNRLVRMNLLTPLPALPDHPATDQRYQPARPLGKTTLADFKQADDGLGEEATGPALGHLEPLLDHYNHELENMTGTDLFTTPLDKLLTDHPVDDPSPAPSKT